TYSPEYLHLLFLDGGTLPSGRRVFNIEAHPLPIFTWTLEEQTAYGIADEHLPSAML
ncbi:hypothetical protein BKA83DRAFT_291854, partial [Pisolithus microcarpus]